MATTILFSDNGFILEDDSDYPRLVVQWSDFNHKDKKYFIPSNRPIVSLKTQKKLLALLDEE